MARQKPNKAQLPKDQCPPVSVGHTKPKKSWWGREPHYVPDRSEQNNIDYDTLVVACSAEATPTLALLARGFPGKHALVATN